MELDLNVTGAVNILTTWMNSDLFQYKLSNANFLWTAFIKTVGHVSRKKHPGFL